MWKYGGFVERETRERLERNKRMVDFKESEMLQMKNQHPFQHMERVYIVPLSLMGLSWVGLGFTWAFALNIDNISLNQAH